MSSTPPPEVAPEPQTPEPSAKPGGLMWWLIALTAILDQGSKLLMTMWLTEGLPRVVIPNLLFFTLKANPGVAFSLFAEHPEILSVVTSVAVLVIGWWAWKVPRTDRLTRVAFGMILGGALGNLIDRFRLGSVVDFIDFKFPGFLGNWHAKFFGTPHFATFNVADSAICIGMGVLILAIILQEVGRKPSKAPPNSAPE